MKVRVTHALADGPEVFEGVYPALDRGVLLLSTTPDGLRVETAPKRDKVAYRRFRKLDWGDVVPPAEQ